MAQLKANATKRNNQRRASWKKEICRHLFAKGFTDNQIADLFRFIDWIMRLPKGLNQQLKHEILTTYQEKPMPFISILEEDSYARGEKSGEERGGASFFLRQLERRFGQLPEWVVKKVKDATAEALDLWSDRFYPAKTLEDVFN